MDNETRKALLHATADFYFCPNSGKIIEGMRGDDKVCCGCGKPNPMVPGESVQGLVHHWKRHLEPATVDAYIAQEEAKRNVSRGS